MKLVSQKLLDGQLEGLSLANKTSVEEPKLNQLAASTKGAIGVRTPTGWSEFGGEIPLFDFLTHTFTPGGATDRTGPTLSRLRSAYAAAPWAADVNFLNSVGGIQKWKVPSTGLYRIEAIGCSGTPGWQQFAARVTVELELAKGDTLEIVCGQRGTSGSGGASFVNSLNRGLICVSGGGGSGTPSGAGAVALTLDSPGSGLGGTSAGEASESQATGGLGQGGAGWLGPGGGVGANVTPPGQLGPAAASNRAMGGISVPTSNGTRTGGFGGAGGRGYAAYRTTEGGGGGYTGGNAALSSRSNEGTSFPAACSKPGTCFAIALGPTVKTRTIARVSQDTFGSVKITALD